MLRRAARERREFVYKKAIEQRQKQIEEKRERLKSALEQNRMIPADLRRDALSIQKNVEWKDAGGEGVAATMDDEYKWSGVLDPKVIITTSHAPSSRLKQFAKEMKLIVPNSQRINRGNYQTKQLVDACRANECTDIIVLHETRGQPDAIQVCHLPYGPTAYFTLYNVIMRHDIETSGTMSEAYPHLIFNNFTSPLGKRCASILKYLFPVPKDESKRVITFSNAEDFVSFRHHTYKKSAENKNDIDLDEVGPRFEMKRMRRHTFRFLLLLFTYYIFNSFLCFLSIQVYEIKLGTLENADTADSEWKLRPYMNTTKKREFLAN